MAAARVAATSTASPADATRGAAVACAHCGLPVPSGLVEDGADEQFCCNGCRTVWETIHRVGLAGYYDREDRLAPREPARPTGSRFESFDDPAFTAAYVTAGGDLRAADLFLEGVHCAACVWLVERLPRVLDGVVDARLDVRRQVVRVRWDPNRIALSRIGGGLDGLGYRPHPYRGARIHELRKAENRGHLVRIGVAGACAANVCVIAFALYGGMFSGMEPHLETLFRYVSLGLTLIAVAGPGRVFFRGAVAGLRARVMHMDLPVAIALAAGTAWGAVNTIRGAGEVYFESLTAVTFLLLVGRWIQQRQQWVAHDAIELLYCLTPSTARRIEPDGSVREVPVEALAAGDRVEIRGGDTVPADGTLTAGAATLDLSLLTGESKPVARAAHDRLHAGAINRGGRIVLAVEAAGTRTRIGRLMAMVEEFARTRPPVVRLADRIAHVFVIVVLAVAAVTGVVWLRLDPALAPEHVIALLIVTCPCALGLATPLAMVAAIGRAARSGILIKGGTAIEQLATPGLLVLDKTGTVTQGRTALASWRGPDEVKPLVATIEAEVEHPIARAFVEAFAGEAPAAGGIAGEATGAGDVSSITRLAGRGVEGVVSGRTIAVGSRGFIDECAASMPDWADAEERRLAERALSPVYVAVDRMVVGVAGFGDPVHDDAASAIATLQTRGWRVRLLSGDHPAVVAAVARDVGLDADACEGGASPERKVEFVRRAIDDGERVVMVGDGVNDAAALAAATVGVAVSGGAEASLAAADVFVRRPGLTPLVDLVGGARRAVGVIRRNLLLSLVYNLVAGALAVTGLINPLIAAILMPLSSLTVVFVSYRSRTFSSFECPSSTSSSPSP